MEDYSELLDKVNQSCKKISKGVEFTVENLEIVSTNHMYYSYKNKKGKSYKVRTTGLDYMYSAFYEIFRIISSYDKDRDSVINVVDDIVSKSGLLCINIYCHKDKLFYKNGNRKRFDTSNRIKSPEDALISAVNELYETCKGDKSEYDDKFHDSVYVNRFIIEDEVSEYFEIGLYSLVEGDLSITNLGIYEVIYEEGKMIVVRKDRVYDREGS